MKSQQYALSALCIVLSYLAVGPVCPAQDSFAFQEIWGYLMQGEEGFLTGLEPFTDICYFSARVDDIGQLDRPLARPALSSRSGAAPRVHLVISAPANKTLMCTRVGGDAA